MRMIQKWGQLTVLASSNTMRIWSVTNSERVYVSRGDIFKKPLLSASQFTKSSSEKILIFFKLEKIGDIILRPWLYFWRITTHSWRIRLANESACREKG